MCNAICFFFGLETTEVFSFSHDLLEMRYFVDIDKEKHTNYSVKIYIHAVNSSPSYYYCRLILPKISPKSFRFHYFCTFGNAVFSMVLLWNKSWTNVLVHKAAYRRLFDYLKVYRVFFCSLLFFRFHLLFLSFFILFLHSFERQLYPRN